MEQSEIKEVLEELGYKLNPDKEGWRCSPIYRESHNPTSLKIYPDGRFIDFSAGIRGNFIELIKLSTGAKSVDEAKEWLQVRGKTYTFNKPKPIPKIRMIKTFPVDILLNLVSDHSYWTDKRCIDLDVIKLFKGGVARQGRLKDRYVLPVFNSKEEIIGFSGRDLIDDMDGKRPKWKHIGEKGEWVWPAFLNIELLKKEKIIYLVESPGDVLTLYTCGVRNCLCLFGIEMSLKVLNILLKLEPKKIIISLNNDEFIDNGAVGNVAAEKLFNRLCRYFNSNQLEIKAPKSAKDWNEVLKNTSQEQVRRELFDR